MNDYPAHAVLGKSAHPCLSVPPRYAFDAAANDVRVIPGPLTVCQHGKEFKIPFVPTSYRNRTTREDGVESSSLVPEGVACGEAAVSGFVFYLCQRVVPFHVGGSDRPLRDDRGFRMQRDPFDKDTYESPIFDDSRSDNRRMFGVIEGGILDRYVGFRRGAPYQFLAAGIPVLASGAICLLLVLTGFFAADLGVGIALTVFFLVLGTVATGSGLAGTRKYARIR